MSTRATKSPEILIIGLDGVPFEYIDPLLNEGRLLNIKSLIDRGFRSRLHSVFPPMTPVAWPTFSTGLNPGKHGVFGWWELSEVDGNSSLSPVSGDSVQGERVWEILNRWGKSVGVMNVPLTYPAKPVNGFLIAGFDTPFDDISKSVGLTYPEDLISELAASGHSYKVLELIDSDIRLSSLQLQASLNKWIDIELNRTKAARWLIQRFEPNFMLIVYHMADYFMHRAARDSTIVQKSLETLDQCIGQLLEHCDDSTTVILVSDHGSIELKKYVYLQNWLVDQGLLSFRSVVPKDNLELIVKRQIIQELGLNSESPGIARSLSKRVLRLWDQLPHRLKLELSQEIVKVMPNSLMSDFNIDWKRTKAFTISSYGEIYINLEGRQPEGTVSQGTEYDELTAYLVSQLKNLRDPETGNNILEDVVHKSAYYHGKHVDQAPDILCFLKDPTYYFMRYNYYMRPETTYRALRNDHQVLVQRVTGEDDFIGDHTPHGIFVAAGNRVKAYGEQPEAQITDIAPTILALNDVPVPRSMDGVVLADRFYLDDIKYQTDTRRKKSRDSSFTYTDEEVTSIRRKLRNLGYNI